MTEQSGIQIGLKHKVTTSIAILLLRVVIGVLILTVGIRLLTEGGWDAWTRIGGYLPKMVRGPFEDPFTALYDNPVILDMVIAGSVLVGTAMILGLFVRLAAVGGALMMVMFYIGAIPPTFGWINDQLIYFLVFALFPTLGPGYQLGLDYYLRPLEKRYPILKYILG